MPRDSVIADYLATNDYVWPAYELLLAGRPPGNPAPWPQEELVQDEAYLDAAFAEAEARYGDFGGFLEPGLDFGPADVDRLRNGLLS